MKNSKNMRNNYKIRNLSAFKLSAFGVSAFHLLWMLILPASLISQVSLEPVDDSYIYQAGTKASNAYGVLDPDNLIVRQSVASAEFTRNAYIMFDIGGASGPFSNARVELYGNVVEAKTVEVHYSDTNWTEETLTGINRPAPTYLSSSSLEAGTGYSSWDVTQYVNSASSSGAFRVSFVIVDVAGAVSTVNTLWHSKENASGNAPKLILTPGEPPEEYFGSYYIDQGAGHDTNSGHSPEEAWKSLANIENLVLQPGDSLLFKAGNEWTGTISPKGSGSPGKPVVIGKYGEGDKPIINGAGLGTNTISLRNQHHIELRDLGITNMGATEDFKRAVYYEASDMGVIPCVILDNLEVYNVNGDMDSKDSKDNGGIFIEITGKVTPTWFDTLIIRNCHIHDVNRTGLSNRSSWSTRDRFDPGNWTPSHNVHIHHNTFERTGANALIVRVAHHAIMEYNLFDHCSRLGTGNASFSFSTDSAIWQYNEARYTVYNDGDNDAGGFDSDYRARWTIIQYNYSHDNGYSGMLLTGGPGSGTGFNDGTIVRYNILANNDHHSIRCSGNLTNSQIYNNVIYTGKDLENVSTIWHKTWGGTTADSTYYWNNIFYNEGLNTSFELTSSTNNEFYNNVYYGEPFGNMPDDQAAILDDPLLYNPGANLDGYEAIFNYVIKPGSPAIDRGIDIEGSVDKDIAGSDVPSGTAIDIGAFEWQVDTVDLLIIVKDDLGSPAQGAEVWLEGQGIMTTDAQGEVLFTAVPAMGKTPLTIEYDTYPVFAGSIDISSDDTLVFSLSKNTWDLAFLIKDDSGIPLENAVVILPGIDTLYSDASGELVFTLVTQSESIMYRASATGFLNKRDTVSLNKNETITVSLDPRSLVFEVRDINNTPVEAANVTLEGYGMQSTSSQGTAEFLKVSGNVMLDYSVEKSGFSPVQDSVSIGEDNSIVKVFLEQNQVSIRVTDNLLQPLNSAAILFNDDLGYTDETGTAEFFAFPLNQYIQYSVFQSGFKTAEDSVLLSRSGETVFVIMELPENHSVNFTITDEEGNPLENAQVSLSGYGIYTTDQDGKTVFDDVKPAQNIIYAVMRTGYMDTINVLDVIDQDLMLIIAMQRDTSTSIESMSDPGHFRVYPNPATKILTIESDENAGRIIIVDMHGRVIYNERSRAERTDIDIRAWNPGMYYLRPISKDGSWGIPVKVIIAH